MECFWVSSCPVSPGTQFDLFRCVSYCITRSAVRVAVKNQAPRTESIARAASSRIDGITWL